jgi:hypothetical protein
MYVSITWLMVVEGLKYTYVEYQSVCPFVGICGIGSPISSPAIRKRVCLPLGPKGGGATLACG